MRTVAVGIGAGTEVKAEDSNKETATSTEGATYFIPLAQDSAQALPRTMSITQVANIFGRKSRTIRDWVKKGLLRPVRVGRSVFIPKAQVDALLMGLPMPEQSSNTAADCVPSQNHTLGSKSITK